MELERKALDFVFAFPQADLNVHVYMEFPAGMEIEGAKHNKQHVLLLKKYMDSNRLHLIGMIC